MEKETIIDKYVVGKLDEGERVQFDEWMKNDPKFRETVVFRENLAAVVFEDEALMLKERLGKVEKKASSLGGGKVRRILLILLGLALIAAAVVGYRMDKLEKSPDGIYATYYETYPNIYHPVTRGNGDVMTRAFMAYERGDYSEAAELLEERIQTSNAIPLKFYQAIAYGEIGNFPLAIKNLENIRRFDSEYYAESYWYLSLYYIKQGNSSAAIERLQTFYEASDDVERKKNAAELIYQLQGR